jgi:D-alanyl-D-alanine carboxypeptidase/D-alanyl-D-alanine-endopeptidase (penicillin-binding protein 4)
MQDATSTMPFAFRSAFHVASCLLPLALLSGCAKPPASFPTATDPLQRLRAQIVAAITTPGVERGVWGIAVRSLQRNETLFELNSRSMLVPASVSKLVSVATAVDAVGWDFRYETTLRATGPVIDGVLQGDLLVVGSGDPTIGGRAGEDLTVWIEALKAHGIRKIDGRVIGDDDAIEDPRPQLAWAWDDLGYTTGALFGALNYAENRLVVTIEPTSPGSATIATLEPHAAYRPLSNRIVTGPAGSMALVWPEQRPGEPALTLAGSIPAGAMPARLAVSAGNPTFWFASVLRQRLQQSGIEVTREAFDIDDVAAVPNRAGATTVYTHHSRTLAEIVQPLLKDSINLYGEAALRLNAEPGRLATNDEALAGARKRMDDWGIPGDAWQIIDGSGLSRRNAVAPEVLMTVLQRMFDATEGSPWMTALPVAGRDGTLAGRMRGTAADGTVRAKTGTMSNIRSLAGYARTRDGEPLAFVIIVDNFDGAGATATAAIDRIAIALADFSRR